MPDIIQSSPGTSAAGSDQSGSKLLAWWRGRNKTEKYLRHIVAILVWTYFTAQLFVFNLDGWLIENLPPELRFIVIYKLLGFLLLAAIILNFVPRGRFWSWVSYIALYPLTRLLFAIFCLSAVLYLLKSWTIFFTVFNMLFEFFANFKINLLIYVSALIGITIATLSTNSGDLMSAAFVLALVVIILFVRQLISVFRPSPIFNVYDRAMAWTMDYSRRKLIKPSSLQGVDATQLTLQEFEKRYGQLSTAVTLSELCGFLELRFKAYRASHIAVATSLLSLIGLLALIIFLLGFANWALFKADNGAFHVIGGHRLMDFTYYTFEAVTQQRTGEIIPVSLSARLISVLETILGLILAAGVILSLILSVKRDQDDTGMQLAIEKLRDERQQMNKFVEESFALPLDQAIGVLENLKGGLNAFIAFLRKAQSDTN